MRITVFAAFYHPYVGGYCRNIHELSRRLVERGHEVKVVTCNTNGCPMNEVMDGVQVLRLPCWRLLNGQYPVPRPSLALLHAWAGQPDVILTQTRFFATSLLGALYAAMYPVPLVHVERGSVHTVLSGRVMRLLARIYDHTVGRWIVRRANLNIGVSNACREFCLHLGARKAEIIYNGVQG